MMIDYSGFADLNLIILGSCPWINEKYKSDLFTSRLQDHQVGGVVFVNGSANGPFCVLVGKLEFLLWDNYAQTHVTSMWFTFGWYSWHSGSLLVMCAKISFNMFV